MKQSKEKFINILKEKINNGATKDIILDEMLDVLDKRNWSTGEFLLSSDKLIEYKIKIKDILFTKYIYRKWGI